MTVRDGGSAVVVKHCAVFGRRETPVRTFKVGEVQRPYAQYDAGVTMIFQSPRERKRWGWTAVQDNLTYFTIEVDGNTVYDSRQDVPCDMKEWEATKREMASRDREDETASLP